MNILFIISSFWCSSLLVQSARYNVVGSKNQEQVILVLPVVLFNNYYTLYTCILVDQAQIAV